MSVQPERRQPRASADGEPVAHVNKLSLFEHTYLSALLVFGIVLLFSVLGILTRPIGFLAALWPANAILLGVFLRQPKAASVLGWLAAFAAYVLADMAWGGNWQTTIWLTLSNLAGVATGLLLVRKVGASILYMNRPFSMLCLFGVCLVAAVVAAIVGMGAAISLLQSNLLSGVVFWVTTELLNYMIFLPLMLTFQRPARSAPKHTDGTAPVFRSALKSRPYPLLTLIVSIIASLLIGGPGAILFPAPALLWCALSYSMFTTSVLTMLVSSFTLMAISLSWLKVPFLDDYLASVTSVRLGVLCFALGPLTVACVNAVRVDLLRSLYNAANYDDLTKVLSRRAFMERASHLVEKLNKTKRAYSVIMLDVDDFKQVNDGYGHAVGDQVLKEVAATLHRGLRQVDLFGRLGGEEFGMVLAGLHAEDAKKLAHRLCKSIDTATFMDSTGRHLHITISMGVVLYDPDQSDSLDMLLSRADVALYSAKNSGKNLVVYT